MNYIFDFDGTLVDSMPYWGAVHKEALEAYGIKAPADFVEIITPLGNVNAAHLEIEMGVTVPLEEHLKKINDTLYTKYTSVVPLKETVKDSLIAFKNKGHTLNVLTASPHLYVDPCLKRLGIYDLFNNVWTIEDFGCTKSETKIYKMAAKRLNANVESCVFFDDNITAITTAKMAGMKTVAVYDKSSENSKDKLKSTADKYITRFDEVI